ncbi:uncharacterized, partial [Tachysurus ichikawai]
CPKPLQNLRLQKSGGRKYVSKLVKQLHHLKIARQAKVTELPDSRKSAVHLDGDGGCIGVAIAYLRNSSFSLGVLEPYISMEFRSSSDRGLMKWSITSSLTTSLAICCSG